uniref:Alpha/beta hydrolase fold-3 domain-containing protein n=1 Tax=Zooxanthella nutricula TaxID=1333877 RepID=A0A7S2VM14_9DINO
MPASRLRGGRRLGGAKSRGSAAAASERRVVRRRARLDDGKCRLVALRPGHCKSKRVRGELLVGRRWWQHLPHWIALHPERGPRRKCWEGHCLQPDVHDGRRYAGCTQCGWTPDPGTAVLACRQCRWSLCPECTGGARLPLLRDDPLFRGPSAPGLLQRVGDGALGGRGRGTVIVCPGGNYEFLCANEGLPVAAWLEGLGVTALVLRYRLLPRHNFWQALSDFERAIHFVRRTRPGPVAAIGFSAGGHLVASHAVAARKKGRRPLDAQVLIYPAIDGADWAHPYKNGFWDWEQCFPKAAPLLENRGALLGGRGFAAPPTFLVASTADSVCPAKVNGDPYAAALKRRRIPHVYRRGNYGDHGFALQRGWADACAEWLSSRGLGRGHA